MSEQLRIASLIFRGALYDVRHSNMAKIKIGVILFVVGLVIFILGAGYLRSVGIQIIGHIVVTAGLGLSAISLSEHHAESENNQDYW